MPGLIVTRKAGEEVMIGDGIVVRVLEVKGRHVRFQIVAPADVVVDRAEIRERRLAKPKGA